VSLKTPYRAGDGAAGLQPEGGRAAGGKAAGGRAGQPQDGSSRAAEGCSKKPKSSDGAAER